MRFTINLLLAAHFGLHLGLLGAEEAGEIVRDPAPLKISTETSLAKSVEQSSDVRLVSGDKLRLLDLPPGSARHYYLIGRISGSRGDVDLLLSASFNVGSAVSSNYLIPMNVRSLRMGEVRYLLIQTDIARDDLDPTEIAGKIHVLRGTQPTDIKWWGFAQSRVLRIEEAGKQVNDEYDWVNARVLDVTSEQLSTCLGDVAIPSKCEGDYHILAISPRAPTSSPLQLSVAYELQNSRSNYVSGGRFTDVRPNEYAYELIFLGHRHDDPEPISELTDVEGHSVDTSETITLRLILPTTIGYW